MNNSNNTNCLALTLKKEYRLVVVRNIATKIAKYSYKILLSVIALNVLKLFV